MAGSDPFKSAERHRENNLKLTLLYLGAVEFSSGIRATKLLEESIHEMTGSGNFPEKSSSKHHIATVNLLNSAHQTQKCFLKHMNLLRRVKHCRQKVPPLI